MYREKNKVTPGMVVPIAILIILLFTFYTIVDTAIVYKSIPPLALFSLTLIFAFVVYVMLRFYLTNYEYQIVGNELIIRRRTPFRITRIDSYPLDLIESISAFKRWNNYRFSFLKCPNRCSSIIPAFFTGKVMVYHDSETKKKKVAIIQPPEDINNLLKISLEERYTG